MNAGNHDGHCEQTRLEVPAESGLGTQADTLMADQEGARSSFLLRASSRSLSTPAIGPGQQMCNNLAARDPMNWPQCN